MKIRSTALLLTVVMCGASVAGYAARPGARPTSTAGSISLETVVPKTFGDWITLPEQSGQVVNPQVAEKLGEIYSQILARTYLNKDGYRIMLSLAYGSDQRGGLQAHRPEVCYPAQGFQLGQMEDGALPTSFGTIDVRRVQTSLGNRKEPITYWFTVGDRVVNGQMAKRVAEIRLALTGQVPDGLLFRISSIDDDPKRAYERQQAFAAEMMSAVSGSVRRQLSGLGAPAS